MLSTTIFVLDLFGTGVFAITGALVAGRKQMDIFGVVVVAVITAIGGGTIRDLIIGIRPVFWVVNPIYLTTAVLAGLVTFFIINRCKSLANVLMVADAFGLAIFTVIGAQKALEAGAANSIAVVMAMITGVAGGIFRDLLCGEIPLILRREIYATASLSGAVIYLVLVRCGLNSLIIIMTTTAAVLLIRLIALYRGFSLPVFRDLRKL